MTRSWTWCASRKLFLDLPLAPDKLFGETMQIARPDRMYMWVVAHHGKADVTKVKGAPAGDLAQFQLKFTTTADNQTVDFVPGLGITKYLYAHNGTVAETHLRLAEFHAGAAATPAAEPAASAPAATLKDADNGGKVSLKVGQQVSLQLAGNPTTGYIWNVQPLDDKVLKQVGESSFKAESDLAGAPGVETFVFEAVAPGTATLSLAYARPWETDVKPDKTYSVEVTVTAP